MSTDPSFLAHRTLMLYASTDGHTRRICARMETVMRALGQDVTVMSIDEAPTQALDGFGRIVIGASIRYGHHQPQVARFIARHQALLEGRASALFSVNIVARKPDKNTPDTNPYLKKLLQQMSWKPALLGVFAGKLDYPSYRWLDRQMIRLIMHLTHGPTDPTQVTEFTDWAQVDCFAQAVCALPVPERGI